MNHRIVKMPKPASQLRSESIFRFLVESVRDYAIFVLDPQGHVSTWNTGAERLKGYNADDIIGKHFSIFYPAEDVAQGKPAMELKVAADAGRFEDEGWRLCKDGSRFWANVIISRINDEAGNLLGFSKITRDLTERHRSEQLYRMLVDGVTDYAIFSLDREGKITSWNSGAQRIKGYSAAEVLGRHFSIFYTPEEIASGAPNDVLRIACEKGHYEGEAWRVRKDGSRFWSSVVVTPLKDEEGKLIGFSKITRDITDRKNLLDQIQRHTEELELRIAERDQTNAELESFSYSVSHDLRAPLRAIEGFSDALREEYSHLFDETAKDYLQQVMDAAARMNRLIQDLLDYGRLSRTELSLQPVDLHFTVASAIKSLPAEDHGFISTAVHPGMRVLAHESTLEQILINLISNAIKFHAPGKDPQVGVTAGAAPVPGFIRISVGDNGIGIAREHQDRIFQVFERLHEIDAYPGTGIGLAIVKRGMERMSGHYGVQSAVGQGSTFWIELPVVRGVR